MTCICLVSRRAVLMHLSAQYREPTIIAQPCHVRHTVPATALTHLLRACMNGKQRESPPQSSSPTIKYLLDVLAIIAPAARAHSARRRCPSLAAGRVCTVLYHIIPCPRRLFLAGKVLWTACRSGRAGRLVYPSHSKAWNSIAQRCAAIRIRASTREPKLMI